MSADPIVDRALSRRRFLERSSTGFGMLALAGLTANQYQCHWNKLPRHYLYFPSWY